MNPEKTPKPVDREREASVHPESSERGETINGPTSEEMRALAKALMVNVLWSRVGLFDEKKQ